MKEYAPVIIYTYNRLDHLKKTISALGANHLAADTTIFVVSDGPKNESAKQGVKVLREYIDSVEGFKAVHRIYREENVGLFQSIQLAEQLILAHFDRFIAMEDDIVTSENFLDFINAGLDYFEHSDSVFTISGYCHPIKIPNNYKFDSWNNPWHMPWGYGTWKHKYLNLDLASNPLQEIMQRSSEYSFLKKYGDFFLDIIDHDNRGLIVAPDARICGQMLLAGLHTVMPTKSKVKNIGCDGSGANCSKTNRYDVDLDDGRQRMFNFAPEGINYNCQALKEYLKFMNGGLFERKRRQGMRIIRQFEFLRKIKRKFQEHLNY